MTELARMLIIFGIILVGLGVLLWLAPKIPWLGRLPGDLTFQWGRTTFYLPLGTCLLISLILTVIFSLFRR
jgi:hypothetical protein